MNITDYVLIVEGIIAAGQIAALYWVVGKIKNQILTPADIVVLKRVNTHFSPRFKEVDNPNKKITVKTVVPPEPHFKKVESPKPKK